MTKTTRVLLFTLFFFFGATTLSFFATKPVNAQLQNSVSLSISPPHSEIIVKPGKSVVQAFNIQNTGAIDLEIAPTLVDFSADKETGQAVLLKTSSFPYARLQNLDKKLDEPFLLKAGQKDQLVLKMEIPTDAEQRDYYQTLLLKSKPSNETALGGGTTSQARANLGANLLITVSNDGINKGVLTLEKVNIPRFVDMFSPIEMSIFVKNTGKTFTKTEGEVRIVSAMTKKVIKVFPVLGENVLAGGVREAHASIQDPNDTKSAIAQEFRYDPLVLLGPYTVELDIHGQNQVSQVARGRIWAIPISPVLIGIVILLANFAQKRMKKRIKHLL